MKKQFVIYDFSSNTFLISINVGGVSWGTSPMLFDSREVADKSLEDAYNLFPSDFDNRLVVITDVLITDETIQTINNIKNGNN